MKCCNCNFSFLKQISQINYVDRDYRKKYDKYADTKKQQKLHNLLQKELILKIGFKKLKNKLVLDSGCGYGHLLDLIKGSAKKTFGVEPSRHFHHSLKRRGHKIFSYGKDLIRNKIKVDVVISFGVIEHTSNPIKYLSEIYKILKSGGELYLITENINDFLLQLKIKEFDKFFYRTAHNYYFEQKSLKRTLKKSGFKNIKVGYWQYHDLSNAFCWLKYKKPTGNQNIMNFNEKINIHWKDYLENNSLAQMLYFVSKK